MSEVIFVFGGPGSGKSYWASRKFGIRNGSCFSADGYRYLSPDHAYEYLVKKAGHGLDLASQTSLTAEGDGTLRKHAMDLTVLRMKHYVQCGVNMIIEGTGRNVKSISDTVCYLEQNGYNVRFIYVDCDLKTCLRRNQLRERRLPDELVRNLWAHSHLNVAKYVEMYGDRFVVVKSG